jgi:ferritin-like metal-binding protein YciE
MKTATKKAAAATKKGGGSSEGKSKSANTENNNMLQELFVDEVKDIYWAEKHLVKTLPKMQKAASSEELMNAFEEHLAVTRNQVARLEQIFEMLGEKAVGKKCEGMEGITKEGEKVIEETEEGSSTRDVGLIMAAQKVEHYEIATYGGLAQLASTLGLEEISALLEETLAEEKEADVLLTEIAENDINYEASEEEEGEGDEE